MTLIVPLLVIDELDNNKRKGDVRTRARTTLRELERRLYPSGKPLLIDSAKVYLQLVVDSPRHTRLIRADDELVDVARLLSDYTGSPVTVAFYDTGLRLRARAAGLNCVRQETAHSAD